MLAPSEAEGAPMKKRGCGIVVYSRSGEEQLCVFGGFGLLNSASHPMAQYEDYSDGIGFTNELHIFTSGEHTCTCAHAHTHTHINKQMHTHAHTQTCTRTHTNMYTHTYTHTHIHNKHTHTHTHTPWIF